MTHNPINPNRLLLQTRYVLSRWILWKDRRWVRFEGCSSGRGASGDRWRSRAERKTLKQIWVTNLLNIAQNLGFLKSNWESTCNSGNPISWILRIGFHWFQFYRHIFPFKHNICLILILNVVLKWLNI